MYPLTISASAMREINRSAILEIIRREGPISRTGISDRLDISLSTVVRITDELIQEGFVHQPGPTEWSGGRRRPLLSFNSDGHVVVGVDMGGEHIYGAVSNLGGKVLDEITMDRKGFTAEENYQGLTRIIDTLLKSPNLGNRNVRGIGVGSPGVTLHQKGIVRWAPSLGWIDFPLKQRLRESYSLPITVDNDVNLAALGELWFGAGQTATNMILVAVSYGIGAGIIIDRALYRGSSEASGEIGSMLPDRSFLGKNYQEFGALESIASSTGILAKAKEYLGETSNLNQNGPYFADDVFDAAMQGKEWAWKIILEVIDYLAITIANLSVSFDPDLIVLGGGLARSAPIMIEPILKRINSAIPNPPKLVASNLGLQATVMGAISHVLHNTSNYYVVHKIT